jgi:hypothetical protein
MADITNPEAVRFANERLRVAADKLAQAYAFAKLVAAEWNANNLGALFPLADNVVDGSASDGRHPITGNDATLLMTRLNELVADYEANTNAKLNTILNVAVNY